MSKLTPNKKNNGLLDFFQSKIPDSEILLSEFDGLESTDELATVSSTKNIESHSDDILSSFKERQMIKPLIEFTSVYFNLADGKRVEVELSKLKEISFKTKVKYSLEIHFVINEDIGENCVMEERVKLLYKETIYNFALPKTFVKREEKYVIKLPLREMVTDRFSKTEIYIRIFDKDKKLLNFLCILYDVTLPFIKI